MKRNVIIILFVVSFLLLAACEESSSYRHMMRGKEDTANNTGQQNDEDKDIRAPSPEAQPTATPEQPTVTPGEDDGSPPPGGVIALPPASVTWIDRPDMIEATAASVVKLDVYDSNGTKIASGTGFAAIEPGCLVTAFHVVEGMDHAIATGEDGISFTLTDIIGSDETEDVAVLKLPEEIELPVIDIGGEPLRGEPTVVIGSQAGVMNLVTMGNYCGLWENVEHTRYLFSTPVAGGCSGAPLLNSAGYVIGVVSGTYDNAQNLNIAVPMVKAVELYYQYMEEMGQ